MAALLRRSAAPRQLPLLPRHLAAPAPAPASTRTLSSWSSGLSWLTRSEGSWREPWKSPASFGSEPVFGTPIVRLLRTLEYNGVLTVPEGQAYVIERFGKYIKTLLSGRNRIVPLIDRVVNVVTLKEHAVYVPILNVVTNDNAFIKVDAYLHLKVQDPYLATYSVIHVPIAVRCLLQGATRNEIAKMTLANLLQGGDVLNETILRVVNDTAKGWGLVFTRFEIEHIHPQHGAMAFMNIINEAEKSKRARIIESEGKMVKQVAVEKGKAKAFVIKSKVTATAIELISKALKREASAEAARLRLFQQGIDVCHSITEKASVYVIPCNARNPSFPVATATAIYQVLAKKKKGQKGNIPKAEVEAALPELVPEICDGSNTLLHDPPLMSSSLLDLDTDNKLIQQILRLIDRINMVRERATRGYKTRDSYKTEQSDSGDVGQAGQPPDSSSPFDITGGMPPWM